MKLKRQNSENLFFIHAEKIQEKNSEMKGRKAGSNLELIKKWKTRKNFVRDRIEINYKSNFS